MKNLITTFFLLVTATVHAQIIDQNKTAPGSEHFSKGSMCLELKNFNRAKGYFTQAINYVPENSDYHYGLGLAHFYLEEFDSALTCMKAAIELDGNQANYYYYAGAILAELRKFEKSIACFEKAINLNDASDIKIDILSCKFQVGVCQMEVKHFWEAAKTFSSIMEKEPENHKAVLNRGICLAMLEKFDSACEDFVQSAQLGSDRAKAFLDKYCYKINTVVVKN